jgi:hypothetical protein
MHRHIYIDVLVPSHDVYIDLIFGFKKVYLNREMQLISNACTLKYTVFLSTLGASYIMVKFYDVSPLLAYISSTSSEVTPPLNPSPEGFVKDTTLDSKFLAELAVAYTITAFTGPGRGLLTITMAPLISRYLEK